MNNIPTRPFSSQLSIPSYDLLIKSTNQRSCVVIGDLRDNMIFGALRDDLLGWDVFEGESQFTGQFVDPVELFGKFNIRLTFTIKVHHDLYQWKYKLSIAIRNSIIIVASFFSLEYIQRYFPKLFDAYINNMGTSCSQQNLEQFTRFKRIGQLSIRHLGKVDLLYDQLTRQQVIRASYEFVLDRDQEEEFINKLKYNNNKCPYLVNIQHIEIKPGSACCGNNTYHVYFEYIPNTLKRILETVKQPLPEVQVRLIIGCLLEAVRDINERQTYHGDIYPEFIYLDERGQRRYKIFDSAYFNPLKHGYYRAFEEASFCSPEILANVSKGKTFPLYNFYISDVFSIGMVGLYVMTLIDPIIAYNLNTKEIDYYYIENLLRLASQRQYSEYLLCCVEDCVKLKDRPHASELLECYPELQTNHITKYSLRK